MSAGGRRAEMQNDFIDQDSARGETNPPVRLQNEIQKHIDNIIADYAAGRPIDKMDALSEPNQEVITGIVEQLMRVVYPGYYKDRFYKFYDIRNSVTVILEDIAYKLNKQIAIALRREWEDNPVSTGPATVEESAGARAECLTLNFLRQIPEVRAYLSTDLDAFYDGDPAAENLDEIILAYPGFYAITVYRLAHVLYRLRVPVIPRIMTEYAHGKTGIDINPGATIGRFFFIDHGTGIVIGETTEIGEHVKIYQGVTLGALSTRGGRKLQNKKRHPTIEDNVTIYSGASILGGNTVIGHDSVIGGNVFITSSVAPGTRVSAESQKLRYDSNTKKMRAVEDSSADEDSSWCYVI